MKTNFAFAIAIRFRSYMFAFVQSSVRLICKTGAKKSNIHFVPFIRVANLRISLVKSNSEILIYSFSAISVAAYGTDGY